MYFISIFFYLFTRISVTRIKKIHEPENEKLGINRVNHIGIVMITGE
jgi:hypothetical protein